MQVLELRSKGGWVKQYQSGKKMAWVWPLGEPAQDTGLVKRGPQVPGSEPQQKEIYVLPAHVPSPLPLLRSSCARGHQVWAVIFTGILGPRSFHCIEPGIDTLLQELTQNSVLSPLSGVEV